MANSDTSWLDEAEDVTWLDEAEDVPEPGEATPKPPSTFEAVAERSPKKPEGSDILRRFIHGTPAGAVGGQAEGVLERTKEIGISGLPGMPRTPEQEAAGEEAYRRGKEQYTESVSRDPSGPEILAEVAGGITSAPVTAPLKVLEMPAEAALEAGRAIQEDAGPVESFLRTAAAPIGAGLGKVAAKGLSTIQRKAYTKTLKEIAKRAEKIFNPKTASVIRRAVEENGNELTDILARRDIDPKQFMSRVARGEPEAVKMADDITKEIAARAEEGVGRTIADIESRQAAKTQEDVLQGIDLAKQRAAEEAEFAKRGLGMEETGEEYAARKTGRIEAQEELAGAKGSLSQMRQAAKADAGARLADAQETLKEARNFARISMQRAQQSTAEEASRIAKEELLPLERQMRNKAGKMREDAYRELSETRKDNPYTADDADAFATEAGFIMSGLEENSSLRDQIVERMASIEKQMSHSRFAAGPWGSLISFDKELSSRIKAMGQSEKRNALIKLRRLTQEAIHSADIDVPAVQAANQLFKDAYDIRGAAKNMTKKAGITGREGLPAVDARRASTALGAPEAMGDISAMPAVPGEFKDVFGQVAKDSQELPAEMATRLKADPLVGEAAQGVRQAREGMGRIDADPRVMEQQQAVGQAEQVLGQMSRQDIEREASRKSGKLGMKGEKIESTLAAKQADADRKLSKVLSDVEFENEAAPVKRAVGLMLAGDEPGEMGRAAMKLRTALTDADIDAVLASRKARGKGGVAELEPLVGAAPEVVGRKILPEEQSLTLEGAKLGVSNEAREQARTFLTGLTAEDVAKDKGVIRALTELTGVAASYYTRIPLLGGAIIKEVNTALKSPNALEALTAVARILKDADDKGVDMMNPALRKKILDNLAQYTLQSAGRQDARMSGRALRGEESE